MTEQSKIITEEEWIEYQKLQKKLEIATKALKKYTKVETDDWIDSQEVARKALKEMEGVEMMEKFKILSDELKKEGIKKEPLELATENAEIWYQKCQEKEQKIASVSLELNDIKKRLEEAEYCLNLIDVHTDSLGGTKRDMIESLADIYNICRVYFREPEEKDLADFTIKLVEYKGKVK